MKHNPTLVCWNLTVPLYQLLPLDIVRNIVYEKENDKQSFISPSSIIADFQPVLIKKLSRRLQVMFDFFEEYRSTGTVVSNKLISVLEPCFDIDRCYYHTILSNPKTYLNAKCSIVRDHCEIPLLIHPPQYCFSHADITFVYNELIRLLRQKTTLSDMLIWNHFIHELRTIITYSKEKKITTPTTSDADLFLHRRE